MPIRYVAGDLFAAEHEGGALAQGCNCQGSMGAGVAVGFRERYPAMFDRYRAMCKAEPREFNPGDCWLWREEGRPCVFNLATQEKYWHGRATYEAVEQALRSMRRQADEAGITRITMPRIGAGLGGLSWRKVKAVVERFFAGWDGELVVIEEYVAAE
jgi:O-acetyl-ADP-ribose deacetylase (regulator of RNase III)